MSEKQFYIFEDNIRGNFGEVDKPLNNTEIVDLLNEQQDKITELEIELTDCKNRKEQSEYNLRRENEQLRNSMKELGDVHLSIDLTYSYGYGRYLAEVRVIDDE